ncbi:MAG: cation diffusion facilitator family transporter [Planctomycetota bacterium]|nr:cation diffusion facilitator family transporter [Planctomycetota bacterium]
MTHTPRQARLERNTAIGLVASLLLALIKLAAGLMGNATALVADAVESIADAFGSIFVWWALRVAHRPPDEDHPYGYGKAEAVAALLVGLLLLLAALGVLIEAIDQVLTPHRPPHAWTLLVLAAVVLVKEILFRVVLAGAEQLESDAARADAWHHRSDAITSAAAFLGVSLAVWGPGWFGVSGLVYADEAAAMVASGIIVATSLRLIRPSLRELLDATAPELVEQVRATAAGIPGVLLVEKVHARKSGSGYLLDMHLHVAPEMPVVEAHALSGKVKATVRAAHANVRQVLIHIEPAEIESG